MRRTMLISLAVALLGTAIIAGWSALTINTPQTKVQAVVKKSPSPSPTVAPKTTVSPTPAPTVQTTAATAAAATTTKEITGNSISIPSIGVNAPLIDVGLTTGNAIGTPSSNTQVGRWTGAGWPGALGSAVFLTGHVKGAFAKLKSMTVGQTLTVKYNGQTFTYKVVYKETVALKGIDMSKPLRVYGDGQEGLNMMTCAGTYNFLTKTYSQRLTVYTVRV